jgi:ribulose bisphosphate carboxylase small subunit
MLNDGRKVTYTGKAQIDPDNVPRVVEVIVTKPEPLPEGMSWGNLKETAGDQKHD